MTIAKRLYLLVAVAFLGLANAAKSLNGSIGEAPQSIRANLLTSGGVAPRYVNCPFAPFLGGGTQTACSGL